MIPRTLVVASVIGLVACSKEPEKNPSELTPIDEGATYVGDTSGGAVPPTSAGTDDPAPQEFQKPMCCTVSVRVPNTVGDAGVAQLKGTVGGLGVTPVNMTLDGLNWTASACFELAESGTYWVEQFVGLDGEAKVAFDSALPFGENLNGETVNTWASASTCP